jgi:hypothetical protein
MRPWRIWGTPTKRLRPSSANPENIDFITPAIKYIKVVIPAKAGIQTGTGCRINSGMTW